MKKTYITNENPIKKSEGKYGEGQKEAQVLVTRGGKTFMRKQKVGRKGSNVQYSHEYDVKQNNKKLIEEYMREIYKEKDPEGMTIIPDSDKVDMVSKIYSELNGQVNADELKEIQETVNKTIDDWNYGIKRNVIENKVKDELKNISPLAKFINVSSGFSGDIYVRISTDESSKFSENVSLKFSKDANKKYSLSGIGVSGYERKLIDEKNINELILAGEIAKEYKMNTSSGINGTIRNTENLLNDLFQQEEFKDVFRY